MMRSVRSGLTTTACFLALYLAGCNRDGVKPLQNLVPVTGSISLEGEPLSHGTIYLVPEEATGQPASGIIDQGRFVVNTTVSAPGVVAGNYRIRIESREILEADESNPLPKVGPSLIPEKYTDINTSELEVDVVHGMSELNLELEP